MQNLTIIRKWIPWALIAVSFSGFIDAAYLTAKHFKGEPPSCVLFSGCDVVAASPYSTIGPLPVALLGLLFYLSVFFVTLAYFTSRNAKFLKLVFLISLPAVLFTVYLVFLQIFVIKAICIYCMFSAAVSVSIFALALFRGKVIKEKSETVFS